MQPRPMITYCKKAEGIKRGIYRDIRDIFEILYFPVFDSTVQFRSIRQSRVTGLPDETKFGPCHKSQDHLTKG